MRQQIVLQSAFEHQTNMTDLHALIATLLFSALTTAHRFVLPPHPLTCVTEQGNECVFPFVHNGEEMNSCMDTATVNGVGASQGLSGLVYKCPTSIDPHSRQAKTWEICDTSSCRIACSTKLRERCVFPFRFAEDDDDVLYRLCRRNNEGTYVCPTTVDEDNVGLEYGTCDMTACPLD